jgi:predicted DNA binding CopG/RHH family protein
MRAVQHFSDEYLAHSAKLTPEQTLQFLEDFRLLHAPGQQPQPSTLISLRVPTPLLRLFRAKAAATGVPYQTQIKRLMEQWCDADSGQTGV